MMLRTVAFILAALITAAAHGADPYAELRTLPVLDGGRVKPLDTLARQTVHFVTGRARFDRHDPLALLLDWAADPNWQTRPIIRVDQRWLSPAQAASEPRDDLRRRLEVFKSAASSELFRVLPTRDGDDWQSLRDVMDRDNRVLEAWVDLLAAHRARDDAARASAARRLRALLSSLGGGGLVDNADLRLEVFYHSIRPFRLAGAGYLVALIALIVSLLIQRRAIYVVATSIFAAAIVINMGAFVLRCLITGWAPVTNMYETIVWVALVGAVMALAMEMLSRRRTLAVGGAVLALLATVVADIMPPQYGSDIQNLAPLLRSNLWLTLHVLTIVSSYAAFALAMVLGNIVLGQFLFRRRDLSAIDANCGYIYRTVQVGVLLIAAGTVLGGLWADVSWGRFWGWDPKEVWALIVLLVYVALLHARFAGWAGHFGLAAGAVMGFTAVLMSWYGVNFILGVGLHSYGFGSGGQAYVGSFLAAQWIFLAIAWTVHRRRSDRPVSTHVPALEV